MSDTITREIPDEFMPGDLADFIANLIREDNRWWNQDIWAGSDVLNIPLGDVRAFLAQNEWSCGTTGCVAGWAAILTAPATAVIGTSWGTVYVNGELLGDVDVLGREALDLTEDQASYLFDSDRTKDEVLEILDLIAERRDWNPADYQPEEEDEEDDEGYSCDCGCQDDEEDESDEA